MEKYFYRVMGVLLYIFAIFGFYVAMVILVNYSEGNIKIKSHNAVIEINGSINSLK